MILITGGTGTTGSMIVKQLAGLGVPVRALVRDLSKAKPLFPRDVEIVQGDLGKPETLEPALAGVEKALLLSSLDPRQVELQGNFIEAAKRAGATHVVKFSGAGADPDAAIVMARWHGQTERQLEHSGLAYTHLRPTMFMQNFLHFFAPTIKGEGKFYAPMGEGKVAFVDARDIAAVAVKVLTEPGHEGQAYAITGPEALSFGQAAATLSTVIGKTVTYVDLAPEHARAGMVSAGVPEWLADALLELYAIFREGHGATVTDVIETVAGKDPIAFDRFARDHADAFRG